MYYIYMRTHKPRTHRTQCCSRCCSTCSGRQTPAAGCKVHGLRAIYKKQLSQILDTALALPA